MAHSLIQLRKSLHQNPELSDLEVNTKQRIIQHMTPYKPSRIIEGLGSTGVAFEFKSPNYSSDQITIMIRCELDALPIQEQNTFAHRSVNDGISHKCGHDGHMAIVCSVGKYLSTTPPSTGRIVLLFQPAEETGDGASAVVTSPLFSSIKPDYCFALHNLPGVPVGEVRVKEGLFNFASIGLTIQLTGKESHAAHPEDGHSPMTIMCDCMAMFQQLANQVEGEHYVTVVSAQLGEYGFGTSPGDATITVTLRSDSNDGLEQLVNHAKQEIHRLCDQSPITSTISSSDHFTTCFNTSDATQRIISACRATDTPVTIIDTPYRWSEDFGKLIEHATQGAMFTLGAGTTSAQLHNPDYDFNDELIDIGAAVFIELIHDLTHSVKMPVPDATPFVV